MGSSKATMFTKALLGANSVLQIAVGLMFTLSPLDAGPKLGPGFVQLTEGDAGAPAFMALRIAAGGSIAVGSLSFLTLLEGKTTRAVLVALMIFHGWAAWVN